MIKLDGRVVNLGHFPDGTLLIKENVPRDYEAERSAKISWKYENDAEMVALIYLTKHLKEHGVTKIHLDMFLSTNIKIPALSKNPLLEKFLVLIIFSVLVTKNNLFMVSDLLNLRYLWIEIRLIEKKKCKVKLFL